MTPPRAWIFDLDGTLTRPSHDFAGMRRALGIPPHVNLLEGMRALSGQARLDAEAKVEAWEWAHADEAVAAPGVDALLHALSDAGRPLGIVTRNLGPIAWRTLDVIGLQHHFRREDVLGRDDAPTKPSPEGILTLLTRWKVPPEDAVMVGDHAHDARAGRNARTRTIYVAPTLRPEDADLVDHGPVRIADLHNPAWVGTP